MDCAQADLDKAQAIAERGVYSATLLASASADDFECYVQVRPAGAKPVFFPASAPTLNQTVVVMPK